MFFTGHSEHAIDAKLRLAIPAKYRNQWDAQRDGSAWYCVPWPSGHVRLYTEGDFRRLAEQGIAGLGEGGLTPGEEIADLESQLFGFAERLEMDSAGRIMIPRSHIELTGLPGDVVVVGAKNRLEVHAAATWKAGVQQRFRAIPEIVARIEAKRARPAGGGGGGT